MRRCGEVLVEECGDGAGDEGGALLIEALVGCGVSAGASVGLAVCGEEADQAGAAIVDDDGGAAAGLVIAGDALVA